MIDTHRIKNRICAHRGYWNESIVPNSMKALERALALGFGLETDIRDYQGELVISHDPANRDSIKVRELFAYYQSLKTEAWLALNIKADGLCDPLSALIDEYSIKHYFVFDMSAPSQRHYLFAGMNTYTRRSDIEPHPVLYDQSMGVWFDAFSAPDQSVEQIKQDLELGKYVCLVSPELHARDYHAAWNDWLTAFDFREIEKLLICTDHPEKALSKIEEIQ